MAPLGTFQGEPCKKCSSTERYVYKKRCVACHKACEKRYREEKPELYQKSRRKSVEKNKEKIATGKRAYYEKNKERLSQQNREWREKNKERLERQRRETRSGMERRYGITPAEYDEMLIGQDGCCAICRKTPEQNGRPLAVDHCHGQGHVRGLLCITCNVWLGIYENKEFIEAAEVYLTTQAA